jgi:lipopolysaccharide export system protein LptC
MRWTGAGGAGREPTTTVAATAHADLAARRSAADRHSRRVRRLKIVIPLIGVLAIAAVAAVTWGRAHWAARLGVSQILFSKDGLTMVEPRLSGRAGDRRYDVTATRAFQNVLDPKSIGLEGVDGRLEMADGTWAKIESATGRYDGNHEQLDLAGGVTVVTSTDWRAKAAGAHVDLTNGRIDAERDVSVIGRTARIDADRLEASDEGRHLVFTGTVRMTVQPADAASPTDTPPPAVR